MNEKTLNTILIFVTTLNMSWSFIKHNWYALSGWFMALYWLIVLLVTRSNQK